MPAPTAPTMQTLVGEGSFHKELEDKVNTNFTTLAGKFSFIDTGTPASAAATGTAGTILYDANYIYVCVAANTWVRAAIATW